MHSRFDATAQELLVEIGTRLGRQHAHDRERFRLHWEEHVQRSREMILKSANRVTAPDSITILGAGATYNIPLEELARRFKVVRLVDIDSEGLHRAVDGLPLELQGKVEAHVADATGGVAVRLLDRGLEIIRSSANPTDALAQMIPLFKGDGLDMTPDPRQAEAWKASCVVSSGLSSQSTIFPERAVSEVFQDTFDVELDEGFFFKRGSFHLRNQWVHRHGQLLASLVAPDGRVYWADTVAETPYLRESGDGPLAAVVDSVVRFLGTAYLKTFLTDLGKQVVAARFAEGLVFPLAEDPEGRRQQGEQLLQSLKDKHDTLENKRRMAWAIMTLAGENLMSPKRELELLAYIVREAERISPNARQPILDGSLATFFPSTLENDGETASWLWINDPEGAVTLNGSSYYVEAHILKPKSL